MTLPYFLSSETTLDFPSGKTSATTSSIPTSFPIAEAVFLLSPVIITVFIPISDSSLIALALSSFIVSATAIIPKNSFSEAKYIGVFPLFESFSDSFSASSGIFAMFFIKSAFPAYIFSPAISAHIPFPGRTSNFSVFRILLFSLSPFCTIAFARGCSLFFSILQATERRVFSSVFP